MSQGNTKLVGYGIQNEGSDYRAHVSTKNVYIYATKSGINAIETCSPKKVPAYQKGVSTPTAEGYLVKPRQIPQCKIIAIPDRIIKQAAMSENDTLKDRGDKAVRVVAWLLRSGNFPLHARPEVIEDFDMQISGTDIFVRASVRIQVKCDLPADNTGNLFLQVSECNPHGIH